MTILGVRYTEISKTFFDTRMKNKAKAVANGNGHAKVKAVPYHDAVMDWFHKQEWDKLWDEFLFAVSPNGRSKYPGVATFARAKFGKPTGPLTKEAEWCLLAIGPQPTDEDGKPKKITVPWLGDWQKRRDMGFWSSSETSKSLGAVLQERRDALEAARALGGISAQWLARLVGLADQLDKYFHGVVFDPNIKDLKEMKVRADIYLGIMEQLLSLTERAQGDFLMAHGIHRDDVSVLAQMAAVGARVAIEGVRQGQGALNPQTIPAVNPVVQMMAETFDAKARAFNMPLPDADVHSKMEKDSEEKDAEATPVK